MALDERRGSEHPGVRSYPRILSVATAQPPYHYTQDEILAFALDQAVDPEPGSAGKERLTRAERARKIERLFAASGVERRQSAVDLRAYYERPRTTGERMAEYQRAAYAVGRTALEACLADGERVRV